jgi:hypothetical protein
MEMTWSSSGWFPISLVYWIAQQHSYTMLEGADTAEVSYAFFLRVKWSTHQGNDLALQAPRTLDSEVGLLVQGKYVV